MYTITSRCTLVTEIHLDNGTLGQTFGGDEEKYQKEVAGIINGPFRDLLLRKDPLDTERLWELMFQCRPRELVNRGIHTLDLANKAILPTPCVVVGL